MNIIHLPTVKTHVFTTITGAMKNAFGGLLHRNRHWTHAVIHDTLVDLLMIQQEIHPGIFAVMDGTFAGDGPGPRAMRWHEKDILLASADQVAIDAVSAKLQGFDPMGIRFIRRAHEMGLGVGDPRQIEIVGYDIEQEPPWNFVQEDTFASRGQKLIYHGPLKPFEKLLLQSPIVPWSYFASNFYHNVYWYPFVGRKRVEAALQTKWGQLFRVLWRREGGDAGHGAEDGGPGRDRAGRPLAGPGGHGFPAAPQSHRRQNRALLQVSFERLAHSHGQRLRSRRRARHGSRAWFWACCLVSW